MTFVPPTASQKLHVTVKAAFGFTIADDPGTWVWTDITKYARPNLSQISLSGGRTSLSTQADPAQISLSLDNTDGRFTARNPLSPYWPNVVRNVPLQVAITWDGATATYELLTSFVNGWPLQPNAGVINVSVPVTASGRLRRLRRSNKSIASALFRAITKQTSFNYDGYWSMEDLAGSSQFAAGPSQGFPLSPIQISGITRGTLASSTAVPGSMALPDFSNAQHVTAPVTQVNTGNAGFTVDHVLFVGDTPSGSGLVPLTRIFIHNGSWQISLDLSGQEWQVDLFDTSGSSLGSFSASWASTMSPFDGQPHLVRFTTNNNGFNTDGVLRVDDAGVINASGTLTFGGNAIKVGVAGALTSFPLVIGHLLVVNDEPIGDNTPAMLGFAGEIASARVSRLCTEESIPVTVTTGSVASQLMGPQSVDTLANLLDACADVDNGLLHDAGPSGNLVYVSGPARYNAAVAMTLDFVRHQIGDGLASTYDDQDLVTEWTISRTNGSSANYKAADATDDYASQDTVNAQLDAQLDDIAGWRTHLGTFDAYRLPSISINMRKTPELAQAATSLQLPARISPINLPTPYPPESLDQFAEGFTTTVDSVQWETSYACQPYGPWQVGVYHASRYDAAGTVLTAAESSTDTAVTVTPAVAGDWTTSTGSLPFQVNIDMEQMTVVDVNNGTSIIPVDGTFEVNGTAGWTPFGGTFPVDQTHVHSGKFAGKLVATGGTACGARPIAAVASPGDEITCAVWAFATGSTSNVQATIGWQNASHGSISDSTTSITLPANTLTKIVIKATAPALTAFASFGPTIGGTPTGGTTVWFDDVALTRTVGTAGSTQTFTVTRGTSGVQTVHTAGTEVHVFPLPIYAL